MKKLTASILSAMLMLSMVFSSSVFAANDATQASAWDSFVGLFTKATTTADTVGVQYKAHIQNKGTMTDYVTGPTEMGTRGEGLRMEGFWIKLTNAPADLKIKYDVQIENEGWLKNPDDVSTWFTDDQFAGSQEKSQRIETIKLVLVDSTGAVSKNYSVQYKGHVQNIGNVPENDTKYTGTTGWYADGEQLGTVGSSLRLEALQVQIVQKASDLTAYNAAVALANTAKAADYTTASYAALTKALADNVVTATDVQSKVDAATTAINAAYDALVPVATFSVKSVNAINAEGVKTALNGATVARNSTYEISFNGTVDPATVTSTTIKLAKGTETMAISQPTINNGVVTFNSLSTLAAGAEYTLTVDGVKSADGTITIANKKVATFKAADTVVTKKVTANGTKVYDSTTSDGVSLNVTTTWVYGTGYDSSSIIAGFDTPVDKSSINSSTVQLIDVTTGKNLAVEGNQYLTTDLAIKIVGSGDYLVPKHQYKLLLTGLKAANGKTIDTFGVTFAYQAGAPIGVNVADVYNGDLKSISTGDAVDRLVNPLTTSKMLDNGTKFKAAAAVIVDFGAADVKLDTATVTTDYLYIRDKDTKAKVAQTISYNSDMNRVTLTPTERLKDDATYEIYQSPYMKNVFGITLGDKDSDYKTRDFKTLDVTAPTVVGQPESTLESKALTNLPLTNGAFKIRVKMSEKIDTAAYINSTSTSAYSQFATASIDGNILVTRADDEKITAEAALPNLVRADKEIIGTDQYIVLTITPANDADVKGKTFRVTLAGTNPTRKNITNKVITDAYSTAYNAMANDYSFTFSFEGEDKTAPKATAVNGSYDANNLETTSIQGMTNVNQGKMRITFDCKDVAPGTIPNIKLVDKNNDEYAAALIGSIVVTGNTSYADVRFSGAADGAATLKIQDVADTANNKSSLQSYNLNLGNGAKIDSAKFVSTSSDTTAPDKAGDSIVRIDYTGTLDTTTLAGNVKLFNGTTEVAATVDASKEDEQGPYLRLLPAAPLTSGTQYTVVVSKNVKTTDGNMLQQVTTAAPADFKLNLTTKSSDAAKLVSTVVDETARTITLTFDKDINTVNADVVLKNFSATDVTITNDSAAAKKFIKITDKTVVITVYPKLLANVDYQGSIAVTDANGIPASANFSAQTTKEWKLDDNMARPIVADLTSSAGTGVLTLTFSEDVKIDDVKAALKVYNATESKDVTMFSSLIVATPGSHADYATVYTVTIPGYNSGTPADYIISVAKETVKDYAGFTNKDDFNKSLVAAEAGGVLVAKIAAVNAAGTQANMTLALDDAGLGLTMPAGYAANKVAVGTAVLAARPVGGYTSQAAIQTAVDTAVATAVANALQLKVDAVNAAATQANMTLALDDAGLGLTMPAAYAANKVAVGTAVLAAKPVGGYITQAAIQAAVNTAVDNIVAAALQSKIDAVNAAATQANMTLALDDAGLGLTMPAGYEANKVAVGTAVLAARPVGGYATQATIQTAVDTAVANILTAAEVNKYTLAANAAAMKALLDAAALDPAAPGYANPLNLDMTRYNTLSDAQKNLLANNMTTIKDTLTTVNAIQGAINTL